MDTFKNEAIEISAIYLKKKLTIKDENNSNLFFKESMLYIPDSYGGPTRSVKIHYCIDENRIYLKTIEQLAKREFEEIFGFNCGQFKLGKIISMPLSCIDGY